jgi:cell division septation protein DedD
VDSLVVSRAVLETRVMQNANHNTPPSGAGMTSTPGTLSSATEPASEKPATESLVKSEPSIEPKSSSPWVVNLVSLHDKAAATQFTEKARTRGIRADINQFDINGKQTWRVQVGGFSTRDEANAYGDTSKEKLGLSSVWIYKNGP